MINKIALDIVKLKKDDWTSQNHHFVEFPALSLFFSIRDSLKKRVRFDKHYQEWLAQKEDEFSKQIEQVEQKIKNLEQEEKNLYYVKKGGKNPDSLKKEVKEVVQRFIDNIQQDKGCIHNIDTYINDIHNIYIWKHREETEKNKT